MRSGGKVRPGQIKRKYGELLKNRVIDIKIFGNCAVDLV